MGYRVDLRGPDLVLELRRNAAELFGKEYLIYIVALATALDDSALVWLKDHEQQIDSLTGDHIAFVTFYNSVRFRKGETPFRALSFKRMIEMRNQPWNDHDSFVRSMTYESDSIAQYLGIDPCDLPCLVFFDDPKGLEFYTLPIGSVENDLMYTLREIVGGLYSHPTNRDYFSLLHEHDSLLHQVESLRLQIANTNKRLSIVQQQFQNGPMDLPGPIDIRQLLRWESLEAVKARLSGWLEQVYADPTEIEGRIIGLLSPELKQPLPEPQIQKRLGAVSYFRKICKVDEIRDKDRNNLIRFYQDVLEELLPPEFVLKRHPSELSLEEWRQILDHLPNENELEEALCNLYRAKHGQHLLEIEERLSQIQSALNEADLPSAISRLKADHKAEMATEVATLSAKTAELRDRLAGHEKELDVFRSALEQKDKPTISPVLDGIKSAKRRTRAAQATGRLATFLGDKAGDIVKIIEAVVKLGA